MGRCCANCCALRCACSWNCVFLEVFGFGGLIEHQPFGLSQQARYQSSLYLACADATVTAQYPAFRCRTPCGISSRNGILLLNHYIYTWFSLKAKPGPRRWSFVQTRNAYSRADNCSYFGYWACSVGHGCGGTGKGDSLPHSHRNYWRAAGQQPFGVPGPACFFLDVWERGT